MIPTLLYLFNLGPPAIVRENAWTIIYTSIFLAFLALVKVVCSGRTNKADRPLHGKVVILTGGTTGIGAKVADDFARRGAQLVLLTRLPPSDPFLAEYIQDLRDKHDNQLIYAEQVDLTSLHSIRKFATKWIDNAPPRRLDMVVLCAATLTPPGSKRVETEEGVEETWMVNFLANFHLLGILSPALRAQPVDRDVRVVIATCGSYVRSPPLKDAMNEELWTPALAYARSKMALNVFGTAYQKHLESYKRPDGLPMNSRVVFVDPGITRTPGMRRWITRGSLMGLAIYCGAYFWPWLILKSPEMGAQSILHAAMDANLGRGGGGRLIKECQETKFSRVDVSDDEVAKKLWEESDALIETIEKAQAKKRAAQNVNEEKLAKKEEEKERAEEVESLMNAIKKGKAKEKERSKDKKKDKDREKDKERSKSDKSKSSKKKSKKGDS